jgi:hypothetical protein
METSSLAKPAIRGMSSKPVDHNAQLTYGYWDWPTWR